MFTAINVGNWNGKACLGNTMIGRKIVSGCQFAMGVYYTEQDELFMVIPKAGQCFKVYFKVLNS